jgi:hypothetical protein
MKPRQGVGFCLGQRIRMRSSASKSKGRARAPTPQAVPLAEAFWRIIDPELADALRAAKKHVAEIGLARLLASSQDDPEAAAARRTHSAVEWRAHHQFRARVAKLYATGRPDRLSADRREIPQSAWATMGIDRLSRGVVRSQGRTVWHDVTVVLTAPAPRPRGSRGKWDWLEARARMPAHLKGVALKKWLQDEVLRLEVDGKRPDRGDGPEDTVVADAIKKHFSKSESGSPG